MSGKMARFEIHSEMSGDGVRMIRPSGKLDVFSFVELRNYFEGLGTREHGLKWLVDLGAVDFLASSGWSVLISRRKMIKLAGGNLIICGLNPEMTRVYDSMRIQHLLPAASSVAEAARLLSLPIAA